MQRTRRVPVVGVLIGTALLACGVLVSWGFCQEADPPKDTSEAPTQAEQKALEEQMQALEAQWEAERKALRDRLQSDPQWRPSHEESAVIRIGEKGQGPAVHNFCLDREGNLLVGCGGARVEYDFESDVVKAKVVEEPSEIRVFTPDGRRAATWTLEFAPQAIAVHRDGTVFVAGDGRLARLAPDGRVLKTGDTPALAEQKARQAAEKEAAEKEAAKEEPKADDAKEDKEAKKPSLLEALGRALLGSSRPGADLVEPQVDPATQAAMARRELAIAGIAVTDEDVFVSSSADFGFTVYRLDHEFGQAKKIVDRLRGCCGQMDLQAKDGKLYIPENARHRVLCYDRDGKLLSKWGKSDRKNAEGFGSCCNPMNLRFGPNGDVYASESGPPEVVKRFTADGKYLGVVALRTEGGGCVRVTVEVSPDAGQVYVLDTSENCIRVYTEKRLLPSHAQVDTLRLPSEPGKSPMPVRTIAIDNEGNLLAGCGGSRRTVVRTDKGYEVKTEVQPAEIRVLRPDGKVIGRWTLDFSPTAINTAPDGTVYAGGDGQLAKLDRQGKVLQTADSPGVAEMLERLESLKKAQAAAPPTEKPADAPADKPAEKPSPADEEAEKARLREAARSAAAISGIAATEKDLFVACRSSMGFAVYRMDRSFGNPMKIVSGLRGCCGQMDIQARDGKLYAAENARFRVVCYDREGKELAAWGERDRKGADGFGSCCNPMNLRFGPEGDLYTSEASLGRIKRYSPEGKLLGVVGTAEVVGGCKHVPVVVSKDGRRVFLLDITTSSIAVLEKREEGRNAVGTTAATKGTQRQ